MGGEAATTDDLDPDAPWKPGYVWPASNVAPSDVAPVPHRAPVLGAIDEPLVAPDPWSRAAAEQPIVWKDWVPPPELRRARVTGPVTPPTRPAAATGAPPSAVSGDLVLVGIVILALVMSAGFAIVLLLPSAAPPDPPAPDLLPVRIERLWSVDVDGRVGDVVAGSGILLVDAGDRVLALDERTGEQLWSHGSASRPLSRELAVIDGVAVILDGEGGGALLLAALDGESGELLWSRRDPGGATRVAGNHLLEFVLSGTQKTYRSIDPRSGERVGPSYVIGQATAPLPRITSVDAGSVTVYDLATGRRLGPTVDGPRLRSVDVVGRFVVGFDDASKIVAFDERGVRSDERRFVSDAFGDFTGRAELVGAVPGHDVAIVSSGSSVGFEVVDGRIGIVWELAGRVGPPVETMIGPVSVARVIDASTGEVNHTLVRATNGRTLAVTDTGVTREAEPSVAWNGFLVAPEVGRTERIVTAFDFDEQPMWSLTLPTGAGFVRVGEAVVVLERGPDSTTLTVHG